MPDRAALTASERATYMLFINSGPPNYEHRGTIPLSKAQANSIPLCMERISSWAIDDKGYASCSTSPRRDEDGNVYFEVSINSHETLVAGVFKSTTIQ